MQDMSPGEQLQAFAVWLRTGRRPTVGEDGVERKFNPYHDPRNGRFTFAPGGPRSLSRVVIARRRVPYVKPEERAGVASISEEPPLTVVAPTPPVSEPILSDAVYRPNPSPAGLQPAQYRPPRPTRGSNSRAFEDPMTLEQLFPGLRDAPAGALLTLADNIFDLTGPRNALTAELTLEMSGRLIQQIKEIDPSFRFETLGFPTTIEGQANQINHLRFERAAALARLRNDFEPLKVEVIKFIAARAGPAYEEARALAEAGKLDRYGPTTPIAMGNYIDKKVMSALNGRLIRSGIDPSSNPDVRIQRRDYTDAGALRPYRLPDTKIRTLGIDLSMERKDLSKGQVRDLFRTKEPTTRVVIVRPPQVDGETVYIILRPGD